MPIQKKLVRDKIPQICKDDGADYTFYQASEEEYEEELFNKLLEEAEEVRAEKNNSEKLSQELGDLLEVIYAIIELKGFSFEKIEEIRDHKKNKNGGFSEKIILEKPEQ